MTKNMYLLIKFYISTLNSSYLNVVWGLATLASSESLLEIQSGHTPEVMNQNLHVYKFLPMIHIHVKI